MNIIATKCSQPTESEAHENILKQLNFELSTYPTQNTHTATLELLELLELFISLK